MTQCVLQITEIQIARYFHLASFLKQQNGTPNHLKGLPSSVKTYLYSSSKASGSDSQLMQEQAALKGMNEEQTDMENTPVAKLKEIRRALEI